MTMPTSTSRKLDNRPSIPMTFTCVRRNGSYLYLSAKAVADPANRFQNVRVACHSQLASKIFDMDIHYVRKRLVIEIPEVREQIFAVNNLVGMPHEVFKESKFLERERNFLGLTRH